MPRDDAARLDLARAVRAGIQLQQLQTALLAPASPPESAVTNTPGKDVPPPGKDVPPPGKDVPPPGEDVPPARHWIRTLGRRGLRLFRPLAAPLLHRFEWRVRTAVDKSDFATTAVDRLRGLEECATTAVDRLRSLEECATTAVDRLRGLEECATTAVDRLRGLEECAGRLEERGSALATLFARGTFDTNRSLAELRATLTEQNLCFAASQQEATSRLNDLIGLSRRAPVVRLTDRDYLVRTPWAWLVVPGEDERLLMAMIETGGVLEPGTTAVLTALLRPGDTMVDVGAHIGTITIPGARAVGPGGQVIAIEPGARAADLLRRSLHINSLADRVTLHECAGGAVNGEARLHLAPVIGENSLVPPATASGPDDTSNSASVRVAVRPLDDLVPPGPVRIVKIDAEGYEPEVWKGMRRIISDNPELAVIVEFGPSHLTRAGVSMTEWFEALQMPGFTPWEIDEASNTIRGMRPEADRPAIFSINLLLLRGPPSAWPGLRVL